MICVNSLRIYRSQPAITDHQIRLKLHEKGTPPSHRSTIWCTFDLIAVYHEGCGRVKVFLTLVDIPEKRH